MAEQKPKFRIRDNPAISEAYANKFIGSTFDGGAVILTFGAVRLVTERVDEGPRPGTHPEVYITHRLALSPACTVELINGLNTILTALQTQQAQAIMQGQQDKTPQSH
jgi:hypothetical protein